MSGAPTALFIRFATPRAIASGNATRSSAVPRMPASHCMARTSPDDSARSRKSPSRSASACARSSLHFVSPRTLSTTTTACRVRRRCAGSDGWHSASAAARAGVKADATAASAVVSKHAGATGVGASPSAAAAAGIVQRTSVAGMDAVGWGTTPELGPKLDDLMLCCFDLPRPRGRDFRRGLASLTGSTPTG